MGMAGLQSVQTGQPEKHRERYITDVELEQLKESASPQIRCIIGLAYLTASRKGDLLKIRLGNIKPDGLHNKQQKTGKYQIYNWSPALREVVA